MSPFATTAWRELFNPADRRFRYPFINCTNCGPRYTIVRDIPYDRAKTSMAAFPMCAECQREYDDPRNRRFHAQPNACWKCGPHVELWDSAGQRIEVADPILKTIELLAAGEIVAVKGLGGFHLAVDAMNEDCRSAPARKKAARGEALCDHGGDPCRTWKDSAGWMIVREGCCKVPAHLIVLGRRNGRNALHPPWRRSIAILGVFLPYTPLHHLLFAGDRFSALVMTSGNISEEPIAIDNAEAVERLRGHRGLLSSCTIAKSFLRADDSVMRVAGGRGRQVRRSRGYVPAPGFLEGRSAAACWRWAAN